MRDHEIDQILAGDREIIPSPQFTARVMSAVRTEATALPPVPFPWAIALPGPLLSVAVMVWFVADPVSQPAAQNPSPSLLESLVANSVAVGQTAHVYAVDWLLLSFFLVWLSWAISIRLAGTRA